MPFELPAYCFDTIDFELDVRRETMQSNLTLVSQQAVRGAQWMARVRVRPQLRQHGEALAAALRRGITETFYLSPPNTAALISGGSPGTPRINGGGQTGRTLTTDGWTAGYQIKAGDWISFDNGTFEELHQIHSDVTATGGDADLELVRPIVRSPSDNTVLRIANPRGEFRLMDPAHATSTRFTKVMRQEFTAREFIR